MVPIKEIIKEFNIPIKEILIAQDLTNQVAELLAGIGFIDKKILLVSDQNIFTIAKKISDQITCQSLILQNPKADQENLSKIIKTISDHNLVIAVGSGTINDLCKLASFKKQIPYIIFGTATSMNGYASANASITIDSHKTSLPAHLPSAIYLDLELLQNAPLRLIKSGIGDSMCFSTCQFDWLLSHLILRTKYDATPFDLLAPYYQKLIGITSIEDKQFIQTLAEILIVSGLGMYISGGSYPASQAEHLVAHYIEILHPEIASKSYHGEQISVCTLSIAELQEKLLQQENLQITVSNFDQIILEKIFGKKLAEHFFSEISKKAIDKKRAEEINQELGQNWHKIRSQLQNVFITKNQLLKFYRHFGLPEDSEKIGFERKIYDQALSNANLIRNRFTILDLIKIIKS
ncbi:MAG: egsA [Rickettsiaceae bacterium]|jgi:glycerol-1-phosphate dehydrogenase [NAD(P)+]|nr:egsA [Rickettsiaceae bacterium]